MTDLASQIKGEPIFEGLTSRQIEFLASAAREVEFTTGQVIFDEEGDASVFYVLLEGGATLELRRGRAVPFTIQTFGPGDLMGISWLYPPYRWALSASVEHYCRALAFDSAAVRKECEVDHELGYRLYQRCLEVAGKRLQATRLALMELGRTY